MCPIKISAKSRQKTCSVSRAGIGIPQAIVEQVRWKQGEAKVEIAFIPDVKCILVSKPIKNEDAFVVSYANASRKTGARISCQAFVRNYLQAIVTLPKRVVPVIIKNDSRWCIALMLEEIEWEVEEFSKIGCEKVPRDGSGIYQLLGKGNAVLRVGEGRIKERINSHLQDHVRFLPAVKNFRFARINAKEDAELMEKILIFRYEAETGVIPPLNETHA